MIYTEFEHEELTRFLQAGSKSAPGWLITRGVLSLESAGNGIIKEFCEDHDGSLFERRELIAEASGELGEIVRRLNRLKPVMEEFGPMLSERSEKLVESLRAAIDFYKARHQDRIESVSITRKGIETSGVAEVSVRSFIIATAKVWYDTTATEVRPNWSADGNPSGPFGYFAKAALTPFVLQINKFSGLQIASNWKALAKRIERMDLRAEEHLSP